jgi:hypothetical protein
MFLAFRILESGEPLAASLGRAVFLLVLFLPFSYVMDSFLYRAYVRRTRGRS